MEKGLTDPRHYAAIAEVLRKNSADAEGQVKPADMAQKLQNMGDFRYGEGYNVGYDKGMDAGYSEGCAIASSLIDRSVTSFSDDKLTQLGAYAFYGCSNLVSVDIPRLKSVQFGASVFSHCASLKQVSFPLLQDMGNSMFYNNTALETANLPAVNEVSTAGFSGCKSLKQISVKNARGVCSAGFYDCTSLPSITLPRCFGIDQSAFYNCYALHTVDFSEFMGAYELGNLSTIGPRAFANCKSLKALIIRTKYGVITLTASDAFVGTPIASGDGYIYVPAALLEEYKAATNWSAFAAKFRAIESYPSLTGG